MKNKKKTLSVYKYTVISSQLLVFLGLGVFGGIKLDAWLHTKPLMIILLPTLALVFCLVQLYRSLVK